MSAATVHRLDQVRVHADPPPMQAHVFVIAAVCLRLLTALALLPLAACVSASTPAVSPAMPVAMGAAHGAGTPPVSRLDVAPAAVRACDAPGLNKEDLTARVRNAVQAASGVAAIDDFSVKAELAACIEMPCADGAVSMYTRAQYVVSSSVTRVGDVYFATVRILQSARAMADATVEGADPRVAVESAARQAGAVLRRKLLESAAAASPAPQAAEARGGPN